MTAKLTVSPERLVPPHAPGMRIGLFGGTFDPPHQAHLAASLLALKRLKLDRVWWLVTPGNPLKNTSGLAPLKQRIVAAFASSVVASIPTVLPWSSPFSASNSNTWWPPCLHLSRYVYSRIGNRAGG